NSIAAAPRGRPARKRGQRPVRRGSASRVGRSSRCLRGFFAPAYEPFDPAAVEHIQPPPASDPAQQRVELLGLLAMLAAQCIEAGEEVLGIDEPRLAVAGVQ